MPRGDQRTRTRCLVVACPPQKAPIVSPKKKMFAHQRREKTMADQLNQSKAAHGFRETKPLSEDDTPNAARKRLERMVDGL